MQSRFGKWSFAIGLLCCVLPLLMQSATVHAAQTGSSDAPPYRIIGYYPSWGVYARTYMVTDIPTGMLTHINYAFANFHEDGTVLLGDESADTSIIYPGDQTSDPNALRGNFRQLQRMKEADPGLQTLISIGGWNWSARFSDVARTPEVRATFAASAVDFMVRYGFDGVDIDWEYPTGGGHPLNHTDPNDPENFILLLEALRARLDEQGAQDGRHYLLTIATGAGRDKYETLDWSRITQAVDWINLMTYDMAGPASDVTGFAAPLYDSTENPPEGTSVDTAVQGYLSMGVPPSMINVGVPFYGRGWGEVPAENNGLHQPFGSIPSGTWEPGFFDYVDLAENYVPNYPRFWDETSQSPWLYDPDTGIMITYDDPESIAIKMAYVREHGLGGGMFWDLSGDDTQASLLTAMYEALNGNG
ncbi:MAG: glycoside hydrolase family 18 protein [Anaerolineae bacterium]